LVRPVWVCCEPEHVGVSGETANVQWCIVRISCSNTIYIEIVAKLLPSCYFVMLPCAQEQE
jgi:hypothetical protein